MEKSKKRVHEKKFHSNNEMKDEVFGCFAATEKISKMWANK